MPWISSHDRDHAIVLLDFQPSVLPTGQLRFDLRVAINGIAVRQKRLLGHAEFYVGCTSASVQIEIEGTQIEAYTPGIELTVHYKDSQKRTRASKPSIEPSAEIKSAALELTLSAGGLSLESASESVFESSFAYSEGYLAAVNLGNSVIWRLDPPSRMQAVRDFLFCNLDLYAVCTDNNPGASRGKLTVRPSDVCFYGPDRRPYTKLKSLWQLYSLFQARRSIYRPLGIAVTLSEETP